MMIMIMMKVILNSMFVLLLINHSTLGETDQITFVPNIILNVVKIVVVQIKNMKNKIKRNGVKTPHHTVQ